MSRGRRLPEERVHHFHVTGDYQSRSGVLAGSWSRSIVSTSSTEALELAQRNEAREMPRGAHWRPRALSVVFSTSTRA